MICSFFLGANTPKGFYSLFSQLDSFDLSVVKGTSGSGKSTLIKELINKTYQSGLCERIHCASDIESLDGAVFHTDNIAVVDGTPPHTSEVRGLGKYILTPPPKTDITASRDILSTLKKAKEKAYARAYSCLAAAQNAENSARELVFFDETRFVRRVRGIVSREAKPIGAHGKIHRRFIDAFTPAGTVTLHNTVTAFADKIYIIHDRFYLASGFFKELEEQLIKNGYEIYSCMSPMCPDRIRHIIVPALSLAFVTSDSVSAFDTKAFRHIHVSSCIDKDTLRKNKAKLRLFEKLRQELMQQAFEELKAARSIHAEIEGVYFLHLDIPALIALSENTSLK